MTIQLAGDAVGQADVVAFLQQMIESPAATTKLTQSSSPYIIQKDRRMSMVIESVMHMPGVRKRTKKVGTKTARTVYRHEFLLNQIIKGNHKTAADENAEF